ncbi:MAG: hypothetical protein GTO55_01730 [Armatimonadetes bacterium]|nr:hypothetical protein [Armatimonadota bacterium]NIM22997.1 hypothetical protein [Armatimonadota bacterium]NIM66868.1 hypothetical protein [Armatimonadota bacterium]NIM75408.1 hypothetical protein [Armatimonadota bacterium]NIN05055.1 hypothetical protein [Armatimonadota bacterium]
MSSQALQYHREANFFSITNPHISLRFSTTPPGSLVALSSKALGVEVFHTPLAVASAEMWRLESPHPESSLNVGSRRAHHFSHDFTLEEETGLGRLEMEWRNFTSSQGELPLRVGLALSLPPDSPLCSCRVRLELPADMDGTGLAFLFPNFTGLRPPEPEAARLFLPVGAGLLITNPAASLSGPTEWLYPGELTMQFAGIQMPSHNTCLYLAAHDGKGAIKGFRAGPDRNAHLALRLLNFPSPDPAGLLTIEYETVFGLLAGGWPQAAKAYRGWAQRQFWHKRKPADSRRREEVSSEEEPGFQQGEGTYRGLWLLARGASGQATSAATTLQRETNTPVRLLWQWWHGCPGNSLYPDYLPPRDEEEAFSKTLSLLKEAGIPAFLNMDSSAASPRSSGWDPLNLKQYASLDLNGNLQEAKENPFCDDTLAAMCPASGEWPALLKKICGRLKRLGATGLWLERIVPEEQGLRCFSPQHSHPQGSGNYPNECLSAISCPAVASDPAEVFLHQLQAAILSGTSRERRGRPKGLRSDDWEPIPLLQTVYSPDTRCIGLVGPLNNLFPQDPLWPNPPARPRAAEASLLREEHALQFLLEAARSLLWGYQPALSDFDPLMLRDYANRRKLVFLHSLLQLDAMEPILTRGEFMGPVIADCEPLEVDFLVNSLYSLPGQRRSYPRLVPSVLVTAWKPNPERLLLVIVCLQEKETKFACQLPLSRLGVTSPGKIHVLTFSPELGGKPARLSLTGSEISGHLPPHSASIVWL